MQCLVPDEGMSDGMFRIEAGKEYVLFSREDADENLRPLIRSLRMNTHNETNINQIYIIFSPNKFIKAPDTVNISNAIVDPRTTQEMSLMPRQTDFGTFQKWLAKNRRHDKDLQIIKSLVIITH